MTIQERIEFYMKMMINNGYSKEEAFQMALKEVLI